MSRHSQILAGASRNAEILKALAEVDYADSSLKLQVAYIQDLKREAARTDADAKSVESKLYDQRKEHEKYRDSNIRRFAYKVGGKKEKFESRAEKEERDYIDTLNAELKIKARRELLNEQLASAENVKTELEIRVKERGRLQQELDELYRSTFDAPTPNFPDQDAKVSEVRQATVVYNQRQEALKSEVQVIEILQRADQILLAALNEMASALQSSSYNIYGYRGGFNDFFERSSLSRAQVGANQAEMLVAQAQRLQPAVRPLPQTKIAAGNLVGDVLYVSSGVEMHSRIKEAGGELLIAAKGLLADLEAAKKRERDTRQELAEVAGDLEKSRLALQAVRRETFARVLAGRAGVFPAASRSDALPSYEDSAAPPSYGPS